MSLRLYNYLIILGDEGVYDQHLEPELAGELTDVVEKSFHFALLLRLKLNKYIFKTEIKLYYNNHQLSFQIL